MCFWLAIMKINPLKFFWCLLLTTFFIPQSIFASTQPALFLTAGVGARALGMGGAFSAICDDASSPYWNPAGMVQLKKNVISGTYAHLYLDTQYHFLNYLHNFNNHRISIGRICLETTDIRKTDSMGNNLGFCRTNHNAYLISYAITLKDKFSTGFTIKNIGQHLDTFKNSGWGCDIGFLFSDQNLPIGLYRTCFRRYRANYTFRQIYMG